MELKKILLVAKPWRGGLAKYIYSALEEMFPGCVEWIPTRPVTRGELLGYRLDKRAWESRLVDKLNRQERDLALFINHLPVFSALNPEPGNVLWQTDGPSPRPGEYAPYRKIFLSDMGYQTEVLENIDPEQFGGELGFACNPDKHSAIPCSETMKNVCFIGNMDRKRDPYIKALLESGMTSTIVGNYFFRHPLFWRKPLSFRPSIANEKMGQVYACHDFSVNIHAEVIRCGTNMRTFECASYGIPQLVEERPGLETFFEPEREMLVFRNIEEMLEKAQRLTKDEGLREKLAKNAAKRVQAEHSYVDRLKSLLDRL